MELEIVTEFSHIEESHTSKKKSYKIQEKFDYEMSNLIKGKKLLDLIGVIWNFCMNMS